MNSEIPTPQSAEVTSHQVEFFRLPPPGKRDPHFGLSRGWYYKAAASGEIKMVALRQRGALRGVRLVAYDSVCAYIRRASQAVEVSPPTVAAFAQLPSEAVRPRSA